MGYLTEALAVILSSSGVIGAVISCLLRKAMKNAEKEAEKRRAQRLEEDLARYALDGAVSALLITLARFARGLCDEGALEIAEANYTSKAADNDMLIKRRYLETRNAGGRR